jgi:RNA polymerase sigma-70 factor, ECF subfamily
MWASMLATLAPPQRLDRRKVAALTAESFRGLYEQHLDFVWSSLRRLGVTPAHREDAAHDVFVIAWRKLADYDAARPIKPWLFGIAFRVASDFRGRASVRREVFGEALEREDERPDPEAHVHDGQRRALVQRALEEIPIARRAVFVMHELHDIAIPQVAEALDVPLNTAYSRLRHARREFEAAVRELSAGTG